MNREKFLNEIKRIIIAEGDSTYKLTNFIPYYILLKNSEHPLLLNLLDDYNSSEETHIIYDREEEDNWYSHGSINIYFDIGCIKKDSYHYTIDMLWYEHGSIENSYMPRVVIKRIDESKYIDFISKSDTKYNLEISAIIDQWKSDLVGVAENEKREEIERIDREILDLQQRKNDLLCSEQ